MDISCSRISAQRPRRSSPRRLRSPSIRRFSARAWGMRRQSRASSTAFREFCQLKSTDEDWKGKGDRRPRGLSRRKRVLGGMFLDAAVSLIEIDYPGARASFFRDDDEDDAVSPTAPQLQGPLAPMLPGYSHFPRKVLDSAVRPIHVHGSTSPPPFPFRFLFSPDYACRGHLRRSTLLRLNPMQMGDVSRANLTGKGVCERLETGTDCGDLLLRTIGAVRYLKK